MELTPKVAIKLKSPLKELGDLDGGYLIVLDNGTVLKYLSSGSMEEVIRIRHFRRVVFHEKGAWIIAGDGIYGLDGELLEIKGRFDGIAASEVPVYWRSEGLGASFWIGDKRFGLDERLLSVLAGEGEEVYLLTVTGRVLRYKSGDLETVGSLRGPRYLMRVGDDIAVRGGGYVRSLDGSWELKIGDDRVMVWKDLLLLWERNGTLVKAFRRGEEVWKVDFSPQPVYEIIELQDGVGALLRGKFLVLDERGAIKSSFRVPLRVERIRQSGSGEYLVSIREWFMIAEVREPVIMVEVNGDRLQISAVHPSSLEPVEGILSVRKGDRLLRSEGPMIFDINEDEVTLDISLLSEGDTLDMSEISINASVEASSLAIGDTLDGKIRIEEFVGRGGFGRVYRGFHLYTKRDVAVKVSKKGFWRDLRIAEIAESVNRGRRIVVEVYDAGTYRVSGRDGAKAVDALVMRFYPWNLESVLPSLGEIYRSIFRKLVENVKILHDTGWIHGDLKPRNVLVDTDMGLVLTDFYTAELLSGLGRIRKDNISFTTGFSAPEIRERGEVSYKSDVYSLGAIYYWMMSGMAPGRGIVAHMIEEGYPEILVRCLSPDPSERPDIRQLLDFLT